MRIALPVEEYTGLIFELGHSLGQEKNLYDRKKKKQLDEIIIERFARRWPKFPRISYIEKEKI
jgi:hypothetical protein